MGKSKGYHTKQFAALLPVPEDAVKAHRPCLGCGADMFTDRGHRICPRCTERNASVPPRVGHGHRVVMGGDGGGPMNGQARSQRKATLYNRVEPADAIGVEVFGGIARRA